MKFEDVMALVRAGYTKDEIAAMAALPEPAPTPAPTPTPAPQVSQTEALPVPAPTPAPTPTPAPQVSQTEALLREILGAVQLGNINKATMEPPVEKGVDVVTARLINPNYGKEK